MESLDLAWGVSRQRPAEKGASWGASPRESASTCSHSTGSGTTSENNPYQVRLLNKQTSNAQLMFIVMTTTNYNDENDKKDNNDNSNNNDDNNDNNDNNITNNDNTNW